MKFHQLLAVAASGALAIGLSSPASVAGADSPDGISVNAARTWSTNGRVNAIHMVADGVIVGGDFTEVYSPSGQATPATRVAKYLPDEGRFDPTFSVSANATVNAFASDGSTLWVGGDFTTINGDAHESLAAVDLDTGDTLAGWMGSTTIAVDALSSAGGWLYVGGPFTTVTDAYGTASRSFLVRMNPVTGLVDTTWQPIASARVRTILSDGPTNRTYIGGDFTTINGMGSLGRIAKADSVTGAFDLNFVSGATNQGSRSPAFALSLDGNSLLAGVGGSGGGCSLLDASTGATQWSKHTTGDVTGAVIKGAYSYCGGHFSGTASFEGLDRNKMASVVTATGAITSYAPNINSALGIFSMAESPDAVFAGGDFTRIGPSAQQGLGMFRDLDALSTPAAPTNLSAIAGDHQIVLTWNVPDTDGGSPILSYRVIRSSASQPPAQVATVRQPTFADNYPRNGTTYTYTIIANSAVGDSLNSDAASATPMAGLLNAPSAPRSLTLVPGTGTIALSWQAPTSSGGSPLVEYRLYRSTEAGLEELYTTLDPTALSYVDTAVVIGTRYFYQVAAVNVVGQGPLTGEKSAVPASGVPSKPVLSATATHPVQLSWTIGDTGSSPLTKVQITRDGVRLVNLAPMMSYTDNSALSGHTYTYRVRAQNSAGWSPYSIAVTVTVP